MDNAKPLCPACGGHHEPDSDQTYVDYEGYRFRKPFRCMCCGKEICALQFAFGRCCPPCDIGACDTGNRAFRISAVHAHPPWWDQTGITTKRFAEAVGAVPIEKVVGER